MHEFGLQLGPMVEFLRGSKGVQNTSSGKVWEVLHLSKETLLFSYPQKVE